MMRCISPDDIIIIHNQAHTSIPEAGENAIISRSSRTGPGHGVHEATRDTPDTIARGRMCLTGRVRPLRVVRRDRSVDFINMELVEVYWKQYN
jgi:hypothetical protein